MTKQLSTDGQNSADKAEQQPATSAGAELSDHFHRVRLTSLVLSSTLLLLSLQDSGSGTVAFLGVNVPAQNIPFVLLAVGLAALFSLSHACSIWYSQTRKFDERMKIATDDLAKFRGLIDRFTVMEQRISSRSDELIAAEHALSNEDGKIVDYERARSAFLNAISLDDAPNPLHPADDNIAFDRRYTPEVFGPIGHDRIYQALKPAILKHIGKSEAGDTSSYADDFRIAIGKALEAERPGYLKIHQAYIDHLTSLFSKGLKKIVENALRRADTWVDVNAKAEAELKADIGEAVKSVELARSELVQPLKDARRDLSRALRPLQAANANDRLLIFGFDLWAAIGLFLVAVANAVGNVMASGTPSLPRSTQQLLASISGPYWWAWTIVAIAAATGAIVRFRSRRKRQREDSAPARS